jgi:hypothetical protein
MREKDGRKSRKNKSQKEVKNEYYSQKFSLLNDELCFFLLRIRPGLWGRE